MNTETVRTHYPDYRRWSDIQQQSRSTKKALRKALGFIPTLSYEDFFQIGVVLYESEVEGEKYSLLHDRWRGRAEFNRIRTGAGSSEVRQAIAQAAALYAIEAGPDLRDAVSTKYVDLGINAIKKNIAPGSAPEVLVVGAGNVAERWVSR